MSFRFGDFELDQERRQLLRSGRPVPLEPKAYELSSLLLERRPRALSRAQIRDVVWPQTFVSESTLAVAVNGIREALDDDARHPRFIRTVHGFGYAFCGEAREGGDGRPATGRALQEPGPAKGTASTRPEPVARTTGVSAGRDPAPPVRRRAWAFVGTVALALIVVGGYVLKAHRYPGSRRTPGGRTADQPSRCGAGSRTKAGWERAPSPERPSWAGGRGRSSRACARQTGRPTANSWRS